jgi:hypothetical protein
VPYLNCGQGEGARGIAENSAKSVQKVDEERLQGILQERIRLVVPRLPLGHESLKTPEFSAE